MSTLYLLRHAKAGWATPGMRDFDRSLDGTGRADAEATGRAMAAGELAPQTVLCSTARRARETLAGVAGQFPMGNAAYLDSLYDSDAARYLAVVRERGEADSLLVVGHNPMLEDLALGLCADGEEAALRTLKAGFPTSGLAVIHMPCALSDAALHCGFLKAFLTPRRG